MHDRNAVDHMNALELRLCMFQSLSVEGIDGRHRTQDAIRSPDAIGSVLLAAAGCSGKRRCMFHIIRKRCVEDSFDFMNASDYRR